MANGEHRPKGLRRKRPGGRVVCCVTCGRYHGDSIRDDT